MTDPQIGKPRKAQTQSATQLAKAAAWWLYLQGAAALVWWGVLFCLPQSRQFFLPAGTPDVGLLAFSIPDLVLFVAGAWAAAYGLTSVEPWSRHVLCLHAGAAAYAALFCLTLSVLSNAAWLGAALMTPSVTITLVLVRLLLKERSAHE